MSAQDKAWYIWEYYKFPIFVTILLLAFSISMIGQLFNRENAFLKYTLINLPTVSQPEPTPLTTDFHMAIELSDYDIVFYESLSLSSMEDISPNDYETLQMLIARGSAKELDILLLPIDDIERLSVFGFLGNLETVLPTDLWSAVEGNAIYITDAETNISYPAALDVSNCDAVQKCGFISNSVALCIVPNSKRLDNCVSAVRYIFSE